jgi:hypothetical protein
MLTDFSFSARLYAGAWGGLLLILAFDFVAGTVLKWGPRQAVRVTHYEPPRGISATIAATLVENGRCERSFATAIVSLAAKGYVKVLQEADWFSVELIRAPDSQLRPEESVVLSSLFPPGAKSYSFNNRDSSRLFEAYRDFRSTVQDIVIPEFISTHPVLWLFGLAFSLVVLEPMFLSAFSLGNDFSLPSVVFMCVLILLGASCLVAALRVWPATLTKLASQIPGSRRPRRRVNLDDAIPILLTGSTLPGLAFLAVLTSTEFAVLAASAVALNVWSWHQLTAPTAAGRKVLTELWSFREFLARADADRLDRENLPGATPHTLEPYMPYAVALSAEHGWGEEFVGNILELLQVDQAYGVFTNLQARDGGPATLSLSERKRSPRW